MVSPPAAPRQGAHNLTLWSLLALAAGLGIGMALHGSTAPWTTTLVQWVSPIGEVWLRLLRMTVIPLVVTQMFVAVLGSHGQGSLAALGGKALLLFVGMMVLAAVFTVAAGAPMVALFPTDAFTVASLKAGTVVPEALRAVPPGGHESLGGWLTGLIPINVFQAAAGSEILPLLVFTILFALAATRVAPDRLELLLRIGRAVSDAAMVLVRWIIQVTPVGVFALSVVMAAGAGWGAAGFMGAFVLISCLLMAAFTILLYPITTLLGRVPIRRFARAVAPAQLVAAGTRSSLASLPALVKGAHDELRLSAAATGFVLPLAVAAFKVNMTITGPVRLLLISHVFGIPLTPGTIVTFVMTVIMVSFTSLGVPGGGGAMRNLPAYLAAGLPIEAIVLLEAVDVIPDIFKTVLNVTGDMGVATILSRGKTVDATA